MGAVAPPGQAQDLPLPQDIEKNRATLCGAEVPGQTPHAVRTTYDAGRLPVYPFPIIMPYSQLCDELRNLRQVEVVIR